MSEGDGYWIDAQMVFIAELQPDDPKVFESIARQVDARKPTSQPVPKPIPRSFARSDSIDRPLITEIVVTKGKTSKDLIAACPACVQSGGDSHGDNLRISIDNPRAFNCVWNGPGFGHSTEEIYAALGY